MVTPRITRALNPHRRKLTLKQIRAGFGGKRRLASLKGSKRHVHKRPKAKASNPRKRRRRATAKAKNATRVVYRTKYKTRTKKVYVKAKPRRRASSKAKNPKRRRRSNPGPYLLTMAPVGNPHRRKRRKSVAKARRRVSAKGRSGKRNPTRRRRVAKHSNHRRRGSRNPMDSSLLKKGFGVFLGFSAAKKVPPMLGASMNSSPMMSLLATAITAGVAAWVSKRFIPGPIAEGVLWGGVGGVINMAWNTWAPPSIAGYAGVGDFVNGGFPLPQGPVRFPIAAAPMQAPNGSQVNVGAFGRAW
jgi:hypothetical protein